MNDAGLTGTVAIALLDDMERALAELKATLAEPSPPRAAARRRRGWSAAQHVEHIGHVLRLTADRLEANAGRLRQGTLGRRPWRDPIQAFVVRRFMREPFPKGARAVKDAQPGPEPEPAAAVALVEQGAARHRALVQGLDPEDRERLWFYNPFIPLPWHYTLPEILRVHAVHARHHARLARGA